MNRRRFALLLAGMLGAALPAVPGFKGVRYKARRAARLDTKEGRAAEAHGIEFHVTADEPFPVRALDPVLHVGGYEVRAYRYGNMQNTLLIFTCTEPDKLEDNAPVWLQYENDTESRTDLTPFRRSQVE
ncbi:MAG: hypothetical protein HY235_25705 [Acidobacteria bacterium]|nr:hypothetical protein [Acidobacteriota bacterium]